MLNCALSFSGLTNHSPLPYPENKNIAIRPPPGPFSGRRAAIFIAVDSHITLYPKSFFACPSCIESFHPQHTRGCPCVDTLFRVEYTGSREIPPMLTMRHRWEYCRYPVSALHRPKKHLFPRLMRHWKTGSLAPGFHRPRPGIFLPILAAVQQ